MDGHCSQCATPLRGRQRRFCSRGCKNRDTNARLQAYQSQQARGRARKAELMVERGSRCERCGYDQNDAALTWHHQEPAIKAFDLDLRAFSNHSMTALRREAAKCLLLCANCHAEEHHPAFARR